MRNILSSIYLVLFSLLVFVSIIVALLTAAYQNTSPANPTYQFAIQHHITILIFAIFIAMGYGFFWATYLQRQIKKSQTDVAQLISVVRQFLSIEERSVIDHLIEHNGKSTQADIARLNDMGRVKALRTCQKLKDRNIITITAHGKVRKIKLIQDFSKKM